MNILITGGAGFIGSAVVRLAISRGHNVVNLDALTYAATLESLASISNHPNYSFVRLDIRDRENLDAVFLEYEPDVVMHLAAESHVDRSISDPLAFLETNVLGTVNLLNAFKSSCKLNFQGKRFYHVSTDEVYGETIKKKVKNQF